MDSNYIHYLSEWPSLTSYKIGLKPSASFQCSEIYPKVISARLGLTHWGRVTHICVSKLIIIGSDNGLSPDRRQAIIWTNARLLSIAPLRTYFNENLIKIQQFSLKKMHVKLSSAKWRPSCLSLDQLRFYLVCTILYEAVAECLPFLPTDLMTQLEMPCCIQHSEPRRHPQQIYVAGGFLQSRTG